MSTLKFLGKPYQTELVFNNSFTPETITALTDKQEDMNAVSQAVNTALLTMKRLSTKQVKTLVPTTIGMLLITTKV